MRRTTGSITTDYLRNKMKSDKSVVAITAGTPALYGFTPDERKAFGRQFLDVGIAEQTAVAMASAIAKNGGKPVFNVYRLIHSENLRSAFTGLVH